MEIIHSSVVIYNTKRELRVNEKEKPPFIRKKLCYNVDINLITQSDDRSISLNHSVRRD